MKFAAATIVILSASQALAQSYEITSSTIDGGGVTMSAGAFTLMGTIGQPDAGPVLAMNTLSIAGGFWPGVARPAACPADFAAPFGALNFFDVAAFIGLYNAADLQADFAAPFGALNFFDVAAFIASYNAGCP
ncbi:MAG: GC-type dockerin domain-anchored protein [Phycisphaerales bacterium]